MNVSFRKLQHDALLRRFLGGRLPHHSLLYKELGRLGRSCPSLPDELRKLNQGIIAPCLPHGLILDLDSTVETVYGDQAGAAKGTNPHKPGRKSYHPLLAFEGKSRLNLNAVLRPGNTHSSTNAADFLKQTFDLLGERKVKYARFDKGFGGEDFYRLWESNNVGYVGKLKWTKRLAKEVRACRYWTRYVDEEWIIEGITLIYKATSWTKSRCIAIIRKTQVFEHGQGRIVFDEDWQYEALVTNLEWAPIVQPSLVIRG
nr:transposase [Paenibacillus konkukensis]